MSEVKDSIRFDRQVVIVTGAGRNLGENMLLSLLVAVHWSL